MAEDEALRQQHDKLRIRTRLAHLLGWHTQLEDTSLTDDEFVRAVINRYLKHRGLALIDVNE